MEENNHIIDNIFLSHRLILTTVLDKLNGNGILSYLEFKNNEEVQQTSLTSLRNSILRKEK